MYELIKQKLEGYLDFRERKHRGKYLAILALRECKIEEMGEMGDMSHEQLSNVCVAYGSLERMWRAVLADYKELRGSDYDEKTELEQKKMQSLGYEPTNKEVLKAIERDVKDWDFELANYAYCDLQDCCHKELHLLHNDNDEGGNTGNNYCHREDDDYQSWVKVPTLSELIEACGDDFTWLQKNDGWWECCTKTKPIENTTGSTAEIAVSNLWLKLNEKH